MADRSVIQNSRRLDLAKNKGKDKDTTKLITKRNEL